MRVSFNLTQDQLNRLDTFASLCGSDRDYVIQQLIDRLPGGRPYTWIDAEGRQRSISFDLLRQAGFAEDLEAIHVELQQELQSLINQGYSPMDAPKYMSDASDQRLMKVIQEGFDRGLLQWRQLPDGNWTAIAAEKLLNRAVKRGFG